MPQDTQKKILTTLISLFLEQIFIRILFPYAGIQIGSLVFIPSLIFAWYWGPLIGFLGTFLSTAITLANFYLIGLSINDFYNTRIGIILPFIFSVGFGLLKNAIEKNKALTAKLESQSKTLTSALEEKIKTEQILLQKIDFIKFANKISSDFINIPPLLIESRIESSVRIIFDFVKADSCCIYILREGDTYLSLYKEINGNKESALYSHLYRIEMDKISDLYQTLTSQSYIEIDKQFWNHPVLEIFKGQTTILLPLLSNDVLFGIISFENYITGKDWSQFHAEVFPLTKQIIAYAFERKFAEEKISTQYDELKSYSESMFIANLKLNNLNETLIQTSKELTESEKRFRELAENLEDVIWLLSGKEVLYVNPAYEKIWGKKREDLYKNPLDFFDIVFDDDKKDLIKKFSEHDFEKNGVLQLEFRIVDNNSGIVKWISARSFLISQENGKLKTAGIAEDITLRKKAEEEIKNSLDKAMELNQLKSRFISTVSHELRTPLATILSSIELLNNYESQMKSDEKSNHFTKIIASIDYLTNLLDDVIIIDKTESGVVSVNYEKIDLIELMKSIIEKILVIKTANVNINFTSGVSFSKINTDKKLLTQVINNLITNAIKFSEPNSTVEVSVEVKKYIFIIKVKDHGMGIPNEAQTNIFVPFFRASNVQNVQGTGLGLSIAKRWIDLLNGKISFESKPKKGTTFTIILPTDSENFKDDNL